MREGRKWKKEKDVEGWRGRERGAERERKKKYNYKNMNKNKDKGTSTEKMPRLLREGRWAYQTLDLARRRDGSR